MKKIYLISFLIAGCCSSCSSDSNNPEENIDPHNILYGTYKLTELVSNDPSLINGGSTESYNLVEELGCLDVQWTLKKDNLAESREIKLTLEKEVDTDYWIFGCGNMENNTTSWSVTGNELKVSGSTLQIMGNQLTLDREPDEFLFHRTVYRKQ